MKRNNHGNRTNPKIGTTHVEAQDYPYRPERGPIIWPKVVLGYALAGAFFGSIGVMIVNSAKENNLLETELPALVEEDGFTLERIISTEIPYDSPVHEGLDSATIAISAGDGCVGIEPVFVEYEKLQDSTHIADAVSYSIDIGNRTHVTFNNRTQAEALLGLRLCDESPRLPITNPADIPSGLQ